MAELNLYFKEFNVAEAWSFCESSFCVDRGWGGSTIDMERIGRRQSHIVDRGGRLTTDMEWIDRRQSYGGDSSTIGMGDQQSTCWLLILSMSKVDPPHRTMLPHYLRAKHGVEADRKKDTCHFGHKTQQMKFGKKPRKPDKSCVRESNNRILVVLYSGLPIFIFLVWFSWFAYFTTYGIVILTLKHFSVCANYYFV